MDATLHDDSKMKRHVGEDKLLRVGRPSVLLAAAKWWPLSARLASALIHHGCQVSAVCPPRHPLTHISGIARLLPYAGVFSLASLQQALRDQSVDVIVPCDDGVVAQLHALHGRDPSLRSLIEHSLGPPSSYPVVQSRLQLLALAKELGVRVPRTLRVTSTAELAAWHDTAPGTAVLKVAGESGGNGVIICRSLEDSVAAWHKLKRPSGYATACKRLLIDRNPLTIWQRRVAADPEVTIQEFIRGRPANTMMLCRLGEVLACLSVVVVVAESAVGAATVLRVIDDPRMTLTARRLAKRLQLSGFFGLDFVVDESGTPLLIELNPRCTQLGHFEFPDRPSIAATFAASLRGQAPPPPDSPIRRSTIALFPQALAAGEMCRPYIAASHHDIPHNEPALIRELEMQPWPQRQWPSRLYHRFLGHHRADPMVFEAPDVAASGHDGRGAAVVRTVTLGDRSALQ